MSRLRARALRPGPRLGMMVAMEFDTDEEERRGGWVVLVMFAVLALFPPVLSLWILRELELTGTAQASIGPLLGGLTAASFAGLALGVVGAILVVYALVRVKMHGPFYVLGSLLATSMALTPVLMGWGRNHDVPRVEDFDPGDCSSCDDDGVCLDVWPARGPRILGVGVCLDGRRDGEWVFGTESERLKASFHFEDGRRHGPFETEVVLGAFNNDVKDGDWVWLDSARVVTRGQYVHGRPDGRWACLDDEGNEASWVVFEQGRFVEGTGAVYRGRRTIAPSEAENAEALDRIACNESFAERPYDHYERMIEAEARASQP